MRSLRTQGVASTIIPLMQHRSIAACRRRGKCNWDTREVTITRGHMQCFTGTHSTDLKAVLVCRRIAAGACWMMTDSQTCSQLSRHVGTCIRKFAWRNALGNYNKYMTTMTSTTDLWS